MTDKLKEILDKCPTSVRLTFASQLDSETPDEVLGGFLPKKITVCVRFSQEGFGFGEMALVCDEDGQMYIDTECMNREKVKEMLGIMVDEAIVDNETDLDRHRQYHKVMGGWCAQCPEDTDAAEDSTDSRDT